MSAAAALAFVVTAAPVIAIQLAIVIAIHTRDNIAEPFVHFGLSDDTVAILVKLLEGVDHPVAGQVEIAAIIHEAPVLARGAMFEGPLLLDAHR